MKSIIIEKYRKPNQYYFDRHHREIIAELKPLYKPVEEAFKRMRELGEDKDGSHYSLNFEFGEKAVKLNRLRNQIIIAEMESDDKKDKLVEANPIPKKIRCNTCGKKMTFTSHMFDADCQEIRFLFACKNNHLPRKVVRANGTEYVLPQKKCANCGGTEFSSTKEVNGNTLIFYDECTACYATDILELDNTPEDTQPIDENERKQFCSNFTNVKSPMESLIQLLELFDKIGKEKKITYDLDSIKKFDILAVQGRLRKKLKKHGYRKFDLDKPVMDRQITVAFNVHSTLQTVPLKAKIEMRQLLKKYLLKTNWRVVQSKITYRMGYLEGKLKCYESEQDLQNIAAEIHTEKMLRKKRKKEAEERAGKG